jgi:peroxiredoxin
LRDHYEEIRSRGAELVAIGTGGPRYAAAFVDEEKITFPVLLDEQAEAAHIVGAKHQPAWRVLDRASMKVATRAFAQGRRQHKTGKRPLQLGATFVIGPGNVVRYEHLDRFFADHAPIKDVFAALS